MNMTSSRRFNVVLIFCCLTVIVLCLVYNWFSRSHSYNSPKPMPYKNILGSMGNNITSTVVGSVMQMYHTTKGADKIKNANSSIITEQDNVGMIDVNRTVVSLRSRDRTVKVGDFFSVIIDARDSHGRRRTTGGDFIFANIRSQKSNAAGKITDFNNGTYEAVFFAAWPGVISIEIILVHPSETVDFIERELQPMNEKVVWKGVFRKKNISETTVCRISKDVLLDKCIYSYPLAMGKTSFYCDKPIQLTCDMLSAIPVDSGFINKKFSKIYNSHRTLFQKSVTYTRFTSGITFLNISGTDIQSTLMENINLPECKAELPKPLSDGFWTGNIWTSLQCNAKQWTNPEIIQCIKGKHIILMGDSTTRQWAVGMLDLMKVKSKTINYDIAIHIQHNSTNMMLDFYFHPYAITYYPHPYPGGKWEYEILDNLNFSVCNYVIVISPWAHYPQWTKESFLERFQLLRQTILRFMKRCPNSPVLMKTPHPREHNTNQQLLYASDKMLYDIYELYYTSFSGLGIHMLDVWDMNLAYPKRNYIHMPMPVIYQEIFMMFSHICPVN